MKNTPSRCPRATLSPGPAWLQVSIKRGREVSKAGMGLRGRPESHFGVWNKRMAPVRDVKTAEIGRTALLGWFLALQFCCPGSAGEGTPTWGPCSTMKGPIFPKWS